MIPKPNIVILDDDERHLKLLSDNLHVSGYAALPVLFKNGKPQISEPLDSIQLLFLDMQLMIGVPAGAQTYDIVAVAMEKIIAPDNGPYVLVTWTTFSTEHSDLMQYLSENLEGNVPIPAASVCLDKNDYLNGQSNLKQGVIDATTSLPPQVTALFGWYSAGRIAAGEVMNSLLRLVPRLERFLGSSGPAMEKLLTAVAREGAGKNAGDDLTSAMNEGFGPILMDRLLHSTAVNKNRMEKAWKEAIPKPEGKPRLGDEEALELNTMTAISTHDINNVLAGSRGSVCINRDVLESDGVFRECFGDKKEEVLNEFAVPKRSLSKMEKQKLRAEFLDGGYFRLVGLSAACDHAWGKVPIKKLLLVVEMPNKFKEKFDTAKNGAIYKTPLFRLPHENEGVKLIFNWRYHLSCANDMDDWEVIYRLKEPLISHITTTYHVYGFRPGRPDYR